MDERLNTEDCQVSDENVCIHSGAASPLNNYVSSINKTNVLVHNKGSVKDIDTFKSELQLMDSVRDREKTENHRFTIHKQKLGKLSIPKLTSQVSCLFANPLRIPLARPLLS